MEAKAKTHRTLWFVASALAVALLSSGLLATTAVNADSSSLLSDQEMAALRGQGICAKCETTATTSCPRTGSPCRPNPCHGTRYSAGDGITICTGYDFTCSSGGLRKGCQAAWSWWCNGNSAGTPCGTMREADCRPNIFGGCTCWDVPAGNCKKKNCT